MVTVDRVARNGLVEEVTIEPDNQERGVHQLWEDQEVRCSNLALLHAEEGLVHGGEMHHSCFLRTCSLSDAMMQQWIMKPQLSLPSCLLKELQPLKKHYL